MPRPISVEDPLSKGGEALMDHLRRVTYDLAS
jgi:hypothetical protein